MQKLTHLAPIQVENLASAPWVLLQPLLSKVMLIESPDSIRVQSLDILQSLSGNENQDRPLLYHHQERLDFVGLCPTVPRHLPLSDLTLSTACCITQEIFINHMRFTYSMINFVQLNKKFIDNFCIYATRYYHHRLHLVYHHGARPCFPPPAERRRDMFPVRRQDILPLGPAQLDEIPQIRPSRFGTFCHL